MTNESIATADLAQELHELRRRVAALEEFIFRTKRAKNCILGIIEKWPGPFTIQQIDQAIREFNPQVAAELKPYAVANKVHQLERDGDVVRTINGSCCVASVFELIGEPRKGRPGREYNRKAQYESGFRSIVRSALDDLPDQFTLADLRAWMAQHMPDGPRIPYGSWSSTLYKLQQNQELICVKGKGSNCSTERKIFTKGPKRVGASGEELRDIEASYAEFRKSMAAPAREPTEREADT